MGDRLEDVVIVRIAGNEIAVQPGVAIWYPFDRATTWSTVVTPVLVASIPAGFGARADLIGILVSDKNIEAGPLDPLYGRSAGS